VSVDYHKAPFPWFGGKSKAAPLVWSLLGDVPHYVEPFAGSLAVLLNRPHLANRSYFSETVNDLDGLLVNAWRSIQLQPDATAEAASNPVAEVDLMARHIALVRWRDECQVEHLRGDPTWCDPQMAGWWLWGVSSWIGSGWCTGAGPWTADETGRAYKQDRNGNRISGVDGKRPHIADNGQGVNRPQLREPGVIGQRPHIGNDGQGVNRPQLREPGVIGQRPHIADNGQGVNRPQLREPGVEWHPVTMPELRNWFGWLSARLRHVRILQGSWARCVTTGALLTLPVRQGHGPAGAFLDPPYADTADRDAGLYSVDSLTVAHEVREWCLRNGDDQRYRIVLAGFDGEHGTDLTDAGWIEHEWYAAGFLAGGMGHTGNDGHQQNRERLWSSPHCLTTEPVQPPQMELF
jgi:hypothetical protein